MSIIRRYPALFWGLALTILFLVLGWFRPANIDNIIQGLEFMQYDMRMGFLAEPEAETPIVIVEIDEKSINMLGRWPWQRSYIADGVLKIFAGSPKAIGLNIIFSEPQVDPGLERLRKLEELFANLRLHEAENGEIFSNQLAKAVSDLEYDELMAQVFEATGIVVLPSTFIEAIVASPQPEEVDLALESLAVSMESVHEDAQCPEANVVQLPIPLYFSSMRGTGHATLNQDFDGKVRREQLLYGYHGNYYPSYALTLAALALDVEQSDISAQIGTQVSYGDRVIPTSRAADYQITFKGDRDAFEHISFYDVVYEIQSESDIPTAERWFKDKIVILGFSAAGLSTLNNTPVSSQVTASEVSANTIWSLINEKTILQPAWNNWAEIGLIAFIGLIVTFVMPRIKAMRASLIFIVLLGLLLGGASYFFVAKGLWITTSYPTVLLVMGYLGCVSLKYFVTEAKKEKVEGESADTNRMLGLSFQSQGMLDMAFDKFRKVPVDKSMKDVLYSLAQDYERKRQFNKAVSVYDYIEEYDPKYKDISERKKKMIQVGETMILGGGAGGINLLATIEGGSKPTLGRYEIVKQLGQGAMGIVYLGKDPRINRTTAIKTFQFPEDLEPDEADKHKQRFFQEAESAGTLTHPNIVTIYDAGEEQDLAFIAMEFLDGMDLKDHARKDNLLPMLQVIKQIADVADALGYAHDKGIVHRDIKPANLMLLSDGKIKITDFGIARITASSQTQTGVVKGTPHYMSPEQISGKKVDGRSDLFSLGVVLYQLLTGELPFKGENVAQLMHQIMNEPHPDPRTYNPQIVKYLVIIINKSLQKQRGQRYQHATQMASDLRKVAQWLEGMLAKQQQQSGETGGQA
ncbi:MAG: CHASE2 domain-containing protein [Desulfovibrio sp.]|nr:MAG: CHASE2 domain-containing protein [Desulfovibrio sp.]